MTGAASLSLRRFQRDFAAHLLPTIADGCLPAHLNLDAHGFGVHAHNVRASLRSALESAFPVTYQLVGAGFFAVMADRFVTAQPPHLGWLSAYGDAFADFIAHYPPAGGLGYLADVARFEWARVRAANAADSPGLDLQALASLAPEALEELRLSLHPAASLVFSDFPVFDIWRAHQQPDAEQCFGEIDLSAGPQYVLVGRAGALEVGVAVLGLGDAALLNAASEQAGFGAACQAALDAEADYDLSAGLVRLATMRGLSPL
jgi:hypothetical protein